MRNLEQTFNGASVLLTGHTGFKGAWLSFWLSKLGAHVTGFALDPDAGQECLFNVVKDGGIFGEAGDFRGDILNLPNLEKAVAAVKPDFVFHLAAQSLVRRSYEQPVETVATNVLGTANLLESVRREAPDAVVVVVTTDKCYENREWTYSYRENEALGGKDVYSASKAAAEMVVASWRHSFFDSGVGIGMIASARGGNVIGGGDFAQDRILPDLVKALSTDSEIEVRSPNATRPWQHVLDCLSGYLRLAQWLAEEAGEVQSAHRSFNFGPANESERTVGEIVEECFHHWPGSWKDVSADENPHEATRLAVSVELARSVLEWEPTWKFESAVANTIAWYRAWFEEEPPLSIRALMDSQIADFSSAAVCK